MINPLTPQERFDFAMNVILKHEGGFSCDKTDPGGNTNFGISLRFMKELGIDINHDGKIDSNDILSIHFTDAVDIYKKYFWDKYHYEAINSVIIATKIFDMAVNMGPRHAHRIVQESCNLFGKKINEDGIIGPNTLSILNEVSLEGQEQDLLKKIIQLQKEWYEHIVDINPTLHVFLNGWLNRALWPGND